MSCTTLYSLYKTKVNEIAELRNSHGSAPPVWEHISRKLYQKGFNLFDNSNDFWKSYKDVRLTEDERVVLMSTYDNSFIEVNCLEKFAASCRVVHDLILANTQWDVSPPSSEYYRPNWKEATWYQVYETVSEGTPVSPPFETQKELIDYLVKNGDFWGQDGIDCKPWSKEAAEKFVMGSGWAPTMIITGGKMMSGVEALAKS